MSDFDKDNEWLEALEADPVEAPPEPPANDPPADDKKDEDDEDDKPNDDVEEKPADGDNPEDDKPDDVSDEPPADDDKKDDDKQDTPSEDDRTKEAVKAALAEIESSKADQTSKMETYKQEVAKTLYPEGLDRTLRDSDGDPIGGIDDLTKLVNPKTGDLFTEEEAGSWLLAAQQKLNQDVEQVEKFIENVAEVNVQLEDGAARVVEKYGEILSKNTELKDRLLAAYNKTVVKDPKSGIAIKAPVDVEEFFDMALDPMVKNQAAEAEAAAKAKKEAEEKAKKARQQDRGDLKPSGKADTIPPKDKEWAQAIKDYEEGV